MKIKITESQLKVITESQEKDNAIVDNMFAKYGTKSMGHSEMQDIGKKLYDMGIIELPEKYKSPNHPMVGNIFVAEAKKYRIEYLKRSGTQLYQVTLSERVYASVDVTYIVTSDNEEEVKEILMDGTQIDEIHPMNEKGHIVADFEEWMEESLEDALEYHKVDIKPYTGGITQ